MHQVVGLEPQDMCRYQSPVGRWSLCLGHVMTLEPSCAGAGLEPRGVWRLRSLLLPGDRLGSSGHMAIPESSPGEWRTWCIGHVVTSETSSDG
jgi:hypothetical protein